MYTSLIPLSPSHTYLCSHNKISHACSLLCHLLNTVPFILFILTKTLVIGGSIVDYFRFYIRGYFIRKIVTLFPRRVLSLVVHDMVLSGHAQTRTLFTLGWKELGSCFVALFIFISICVSI